jgi:hypothetical protein
MKVTTWLVRMAGIAALALAVGCGLQLTPTMESVDLPDDEIARRLVGTWSMQQSLDGVSAQGSARFDSDGNYTWEGTMTQEGTTTPISMTATWRINGGVMEYTVTSCEPDSLEPGETFRDRVLSIEGQEFRWKDEDGEVFSMFRQSQ